MRWGERSEHAPVTVATRALVFVLAIAVIHPPSSAHADSLLPLTTERADVLPSGVAETTLGVAYFHNMRFPPFTPAGAIRSSTVVEVPQLSVHIGAGGWAEIQGSYETIYLDEQAA